jgi:hypothetical protein
VDVEALRHIRRLRSAAIAGVCLISMSLGSGGGIAFAGTGHTTAAPGSDASTRGIRVGLRDNGRTLTLHPGQIVTVMLKSTFWTFKGSSNPQVVEQLGPAVVVRTPFNKQTCPYGGCGTVTIKFQAVRSGTAQVTATRVSCGEAMGCTGSGAIYRFTVAVTPQRRSRLPEYRRTVRYSY